MEEAYYGEYDRHPRRKRRSVWLWLADALMTLLTAAVGAAMAMTLVVPYVHPARVWFFPILGLAAPAVYIATVALTLYWIVRWRWGRAGTMLALVAAGLVSVPLFWSPDLRRDYGPAKYDRGAVKVMSYNVRAFYDDEGGSSVGEVVRLVDEIDPDIVCLQEFNGRLADHEERFAALEERYESARFGRTPAPDSLYGARLMILSKYRILRSGIVLTPSTAVWADVKMGDDTVRVFNNHLRSTAITAADDAYLTRHGFLRDSAREVKLRSIAERYRSSSVMRASQVDSIAGAVAATRHRRIVCGDFNDTPQSYVYRTMAAGLEDTFADAGTGYAHTYRGFCDMLRIDYVLRSEGFETLSYEVPGAVCSDHLPVVVRLKKIPIENH